MIFISLNKFFITEHTKLSTLFPVTAKKYIIYIIKF